jgi:ferritin-like metal-binding protein YciE
MKLATLEDLYVDHLKDIHNAEKQLVQALPKMAKAANSPQLQRAFEQHLEMTKRQLARVEQIFQQMEMSPGRKKCVGMEGLIKEGEELMTEEGVAPDVLDAGLIAAAQKVEHYEISSYGTLRTYARRLGHTQAVGLLDQILQEESRTDELLTQLAESGINQEAQR